MGAGFEGDVHGAAAGALTRLGECVHLGVGAAAASVVPLADEATRGVEHHRTHHGVGGGAVSTSGGELDGVLHPFCVNHINSIVSTRRVGRFRWERAPDGLRLGVPGAASPMFIIW